jgi:thiamine-phosphate pyrophosphorylase
VAGAGAALDEALESMKPERIVGAGSLRTRDEAMTAGEKGADYVMFGEPRDGAPATALELLLERVDWWAEIFETPCVAYAETIEAAGRLARAGADFVALEGAVWNAERPAEAAREAYSALSRLVAGAPP